MLCAANIVAVALGGAAGSVARYCLQQLAGGNMWATCAINIAGSALIGALFVVLARVGNPRLTAMTVGGLLGGFTTYSAFALDFAVLCRNAEWMRGVLYVAVTTVGALAACALAMWLTYKFMGR